MRNSEIRHSFALPISASCASGQPLRMGDGVFMKICGIYKITSPSGKIYIGQSIDIRTRFRSYRNKKGNEQTYLENSFKKYGIDNHKFEIIHTCTSSELNALEIYYISLYQTFNSEHGLNLKAGGHYGGTLSEAAKQKLRKAKPDWVKEKLSIAASNRPPITEETRDKHRKKMLGNKNLLGKRATLGRKATPETCQHIRDGIKGRIRIGRLVLNTQNGIYYHSTPSAAQAADINSGTMRSRLLKEASIYKFV